MELLERSFRAKLRNLPNALCRSASRTNCSQCDLDYGAQFFATKRYVSFPPKTAKFVDSELFFSFSAKVSENRFHGSGTVVPRCLLMRTAELSGSEVDSWDLPGLATLELSKSDLGVLLFCEVLSWNPRLTLLFSRYLQVLQDELVGLGTYQGPFRHTDLAESVRVPRLKDNLIFDGCGLIGLMPVELQGYFVDLGSALGSDRFSWLGRLRMASKTAAVGLANLLRNQGRFVSTGPCLPAEIFLQPREILFIDLVANRSAADCLKIAGRNVDFQQLLATRPVTFRLSSRNGDFFNAVQLGPCFQQAQIAPRRLELQGAIINVGLFKFPSVDCWDYHNLLHLRLENVRVDVTRAEPVFGLRAFAQKLEELSIRESPSLFQIREGCFRAAPKHPRQKDANGNKVAAPSRFAFAALKKLSIFEDDSVVVGFLPKLLMHVKGKKLDLLTLRCSSFDAPPAISLQVAEDLSCAPAYNSATLNRLKQVRLLWGLCRGLRRDNGRGRGCFVCFVQVRVEIIWTVVYIYIL